MNANESAGVPTAWRGCGIPRPAAGVHFETVQEDAAVRPRATVSSRGFAAVQTQTHKLSTAGKWPSRAQARERGDGPKDGAPDNRIAASTPQKIEFQR